MLFDNLHIVLFFSVMVFTVISIVLAINLKNRRQLSQNKINKIIASYTDEKIYFEKEINRLNYIIDEYKQKTGSDKAVDVSQPFIATENKSIDSSEIRAAGMVEKDHLDDTDFRQKNKKLWELSIAVHKEKDRIGRLKNEIERRHDEVTKSITYAQRIQKALLPSSKILGVRFSDYFILWKPRDIVSGDFYWFKRLEDSMIIVVADCTGHGVPGAFMSLLGISFLNEILTKDKTLKSFQILDRLREMIKLALQQELGKRSKASDGIDMGICIINHKTLEMDFSGANNPLYLIRNEEILIFKENRNPVGIHPYEKPFENHEYRLQKGDRIYLFSDGFIDQFGGESGRKFLKKNFQRLLLHMSKQDLPLDMESKILEDALDQWRGGKHPQIDDILILGLKI